jgi:hypothetical protein
MHLESLQHVYVRFILILFIHFRPLKWFLYLRFSSKIACELHILILPYLIRHYVRLALITAKLYKLALKDIHVLHQQSTKTYTGLKAELLIST